MEEISGQMKLQFWKEFKEYLEKSKSFIIIEEKELEKTLEHDT